MTSSNDVIIVDLDETLLVGTPGIKFKNEKNEKIIKNLLNSFIQIGNDNHEITQGKP